MGEIGVDPHGPAGPLRPPAHELPVPVGDTLGDWVGWWMPGRCACRSAVWPIDMLARRYGDHHRIADVVARMRCKDRCRQRPVFDCLTDTPEGRTPHSVREPRCVPLPGA